MSSNKAEPSAEREGRLHKRRERERARRQSETAEQREERLRICREIGLKVLLRLPNKGSCIYNNGKIDSERSWQTKDRSEHITID